jgi:hypothetical protein
MSNYIDKIMSNHVFNSESSEDLSYLYSEEELDKKHRNVKSHKGGKAEGPSSEPLSEPSSEPLSEPLSEPSHEPALRPTGGFPPIFIIDAKEKEAEQTKNRQLAPGKSAVSIKDILKSKK